jgi:hypothetical protein
MATIFNVLPMRGTTAMSHLGGFALASFRLFTALLDSNIKRAS